MSRTSRASHPFSKAWRPLQRPAGISEGTRWLFLWLNVLSILLVLPAPLSQSRGAVLLLPIAAALMLITSWTYSYLTHSSVLILDVVDALALMTFALACPTPAAAFPILFAAVWFRALYGSTRRSLIRAFLYIAAMSATLPLWPLIPGHLEPPRTAEIFVAFPLVFVTVVIGRQLGSGLVARERTLRRDGLLAATGSMLLGKTNATEIRQLGLTALADMCAATPGLVLMSVEQNESGLRVRYVTDNFVAMPDIVSSDVITRTEASGDFSIADKAPLDALAGTPLQWACIAATSPNDRLLVGAPKELFTEALIAVRSLTNQVAMALRTSDTHRELSTRARFDSMTGLANRATFTTELAGGLKNHPAEMLHVLFLDLDHFKAVNDLFGHAGGDSVLIEIASRLRTCVRPGDVCARLGGDEFAVILRATTPDDAVLIAQRMVDSIGKPVDLGGRFASVGASIGIAAETPGTGPEQLVRQADIAMYEAKAKGKGRIQVFGDDLLQISA